MNAFTDGVMQVATKAFEQCSSGTNIFVLPLFLVRVAYANASGGSSNEYTQAVKGVVLYFVLIFGFAPILQILLSLPDAFLPGFNFEVLNQARPDERGEMSTLASVPSVLLWSLESIVACLFYLALFLNFAFTIVLSSIAPVVFLLGALLGIGFGLRTFFGLLIVVSSWPIVWATCNELSNLMIPVAGGELGGVVFEFAVTLLKIAGPLAIAYFGISSAPGQGVATAVMSSVVTGNFVSGIGQGFVQGFRGSDFRHEPRPLRSGPSVLSQRFAHGLGASTRTMSQQARNFSGRQFANTRSAQNGGRPETNRAREQGASGPAVTEANRESPSTAVVHASGASSSSSHSRSDRSSAQEKSSSVTTNGSAIIRDAESSNPQRTTNSSPARAEARSTHEVPTGKGNIANNQPSRANTNNNRRTDARSKAVFSKGRDNEERTEDR